MNIVNVKLVLSNLLSHKISKTLTLLLTVRHATVYINCSDVIVTKSWLGASENTKHDA